MAAGGESNNQSGRKQIDSVGEHGCDQADAVLRLLELVEGQICDDHQIIVTVWQCSIA